MGKFLLIARSNLKKGKGQTIAICILMVLAALLFNLWLMLSMDYKANFNRYHDELNAQHVTIAITNDDQTVNEYLTQTLDNDVKVESFSLDECMHMTGVFSYNEGEMNSWLIFLEKDIALSRLIGRCEIVEDSSYQSGVYLPMLYKTGDNDIGKTIKITIGGEIVEYTICGFFNSIMAGSHNCSLTEIVLTSDKYQELQELKYAANATLCSIRLYDKNDSLNYAAEVINKLSGRYPNAYLMSNNYETVIEARYISQMICSGIISAMAFFVLLIVLVVIASNIINYIQTNMPQLGALKAIGYSSRQLIGALLFQFIGITFLATLLGIGLSYWVFSPVNKMMVAQTGIPYKIHFLVLPFLITVLVLVGMVGLAVWISAHKIKRIEPIVALRSGLLTHNFKQNHVLLERTKLPLIPALALKTTLSSIKNNVTICITMLVLSLVVAFSGLMTENMIIDMQPFIDLIVGETTDSCININIEKEKEFLKVMEEDERVEKCYLYNSLEVTHVDGATLVVTICDDFSKVNNQAVVFEGRFPKFSNEIVIAAKYAREQKLKLGDEVEIATNGKSFNYLICGFTQISNQLGKDCLMTREGYEKIGDLSNGSYYLNLKEGIDIDSFNGEIRELFSTDVNMVVNGKRAIEGMATVYVSLMTIIVIAILILSVMIIVFVLYLLVRTMLNNKKQEYGIQKSLGFTTRQLILQTALSFMPAIVISTLIGLTVSALIINPLTALFLSGIGIVKCTFKVPVGFIFIAGLGIITFAFMFACLLSMKVRKIAPRTLLIE